SAASTKSTAVTCQPRVARWTASRPEPQPTSSARPVAGASGASSTERHVASTSRRSQGVRPSRYITLNRFIRRPPSRGAGTARTLAHRTGRGIHLTCCAMGVVADTQPPLSEPPGDGLVGQAPPSPAGPIEPQAAAGLPEPPVVDLPGALQVIRFNQRQIEFVFRARRTLGEVFRTRGVVPDGPVITSHPDHVRSLFTAKPEQAPSLTGESPLRPIVGPNSVLTAIGPRHMRQRKLLLPPFHGEAVERYAEMIADAAEREIDRWPTGTPFALAPRMQAITLDVIMAGIFGIEGRQARGKPERNLRTAIRYLLAVSTWPLAQVSELMNLGRDEPVGLTRAALSILDGRTYAVIKKRRSEAGVEERRDILSLLLHARSEEGELLTDRELRDELLTLVLAGHETTANSLAWTWERLIRTPAAYARLRH